MTARKRKKKGMASVILSLLGALKRKKKKSQASWIGPGLISIFKVLAVVCFFSGIACGLLFLEKYVRPPENVLYLELVGVPGWVDAQLKKKVRDVAESSGGNIRFNDDAALSIRRSIEQQIPWLDDVKVQAKQDGIRVEGRWRKPIAAIRENLAEPRYIDSEQVVLDYVPLPDLPIVEIVGLTNTNDMPQPGKAWLCDDLAAATTILDRMNRVDKSFASDKPLLFEIDRIDVTNFNGRREESEPHIVLYTKDGIKIVWGVEWGKSQQYLESSDQEKLTKLWGHYRQHGTLSGGVKYIFINLRDPQDKIPLPIDNH